jgi:hypothetical protein
MSNLNKNNESTDPEMQICNLDLMSVDGANLMQQERNIIHK